MICLIILILFAAAPDTLAKPLPKTETIQRFNRAIISPLKDEKVNAIPLVEPPPLPSIPETQIAELKKLNLNLPETVLSPIDNPKKQLDIPVSSNNTDQIVNVKDVVKEIVKEAVKEVVAENIAVVPVNNIIPSPVALPSIDLIKTCTPDCTLPHCTEACKCANTHADAQARCNPPPNAPITELCHIWYAKCPMFKPLMFDATGPTPFVVRRI
uniref:Uncharacterized protein n=1 Tax=Panagrolaimus sp. PS1159 TaxID=55785 RepID=A0AC35GQS2_9BILA